MDFSIQPNHKLFQRLPSGKCLLSIMARTDRLRRRFFPQAIRTVNTQPTYHTSCTFCTLHAHCTFVLPNHHAAVVYFPVHSIFTFISSTYVFCFILCLSLLFAQLPESLHDHFPAVVLVQLRMRQI